MPSNFTYAFCTLPWTRARVTCEGDVSMCCYQVENTIGNLFQNSFNEIWNGKIATDIRNETAAGKLHDKCEVEACPYLHGRNNQIGFHFSNQPMSLEIDLPNTHCNIGGESPSKDHPACIMCERSSEGYRWQVDRLNDVLDKIKFLVPGLNHLHIQGVAEPFYKDRIFDVMERLNIPVGAFVSTTTNGTLLNSARRQRWLKYGPSTTTFSIDAATSTTYKTIRILDVFDHVIENLNAFGRERSRAHQQLRIHNNINTCNVDEAAAMVKIAADAQVDVVEFNPTGGYRDSILVNSHNVERFAKAQEKIVAEGRRLGVAVAFLRPLHNFLKPSTRISLL